MRRRVLVTGVCGMIGSHLLDELLRRGESVIGADDLSYGKLKHIRRAISHPRFKFVRADILDAEALYRKVGRTDTVVHLAAVKKIGEDTRALPTLEVNAMGTQSVMEYARRSKAKVVIGSTSDVYGTSPNVPFNEEGDCVIGPSTAKRWAYAVSKLYAEHAALAYHKDEGVPVVVLRYFGGFSERSSVSWSGGHVPIFIDAIARNRPAIVHGDGSQTRSMAHVSDLVRGTLLAMDRPGAVGQIINIGNDEELSVLATAKLIHRLMRTGRPLKIKYVPMKRVFGSYREIKRRIPDLRKARRLLGYRPKVRLEEAIRRVIEARSAASVRSGR